MIINISYVQDEGGRFRYLVYNAQGDTILCGWGEDNQPLADLKKKVQRAVRKELRDKGCPFHTDLTDLKFNEEVAS